MEIKFRFEVDVAPIHVHLHVPQLVTLVNAVNAVAHAVTTQGVAMSSVIQDLQASTDNLSTTVGDVAVVLGELKTALDNAVAANDMSAVQAVATRLNTIRTTLADAAKAVDITPDTPVSGATPDTPPTP